MREIQRRVIISYLRSKGLDVNARGGRGRSDYTAGGRLGKPFDLSIWKWLVVFGARGWVSISLQPIDLSLDFKTGRRPLNFHAFIDRLGYRRYRRGDPEERAFEWIYTDIDLPMDMKKLRSLEKMVRAELR